jgi:putative phage-type endonuclease
MTTAEKFPDRQSYLGCSEVAAVVGLNPWKSALEVYQEKVGHIPPPDLSDNEAVHFGNILEDVVAQEYQRRSGEKVMRDSRELVHDALPFLRGHIDRRIVGRRAGLECKTAGVRMAGQFGEVGTDEVPAHYLVQCQAYLSITGWDEWRLAVLIAGNEFRTYTIPRDNELIRAIEGRVAEFWQRVEERVPPEPRTLADAALRWPADTGAAAPASVDVLEALDQLRETKRRIKALEADADSLELAVKASMGEAAQLLGPDGKPVATWTSQTSRRFDATAFKAAHADLYEQFRKPAASRVFRIK